MLGIAVISFDRPEYLEKVVRSLGEQVDQRWEKVLFQDGWLNKFSGVPAANPDDVKECLSLWDSSPKYVQSENLGVGLHHFYVKEKMFSLGYDPVIVCEDDFEMDPYYVGIVRKMLEEFKDSPVGVVMATGTQFSPRGEAEREKKKNSLKTGRDHKWAYGMWKEKWERIRPWVEKYMKFIENIDYRERPHDEIKKFFREEGCDISASSQDGAMDMGIFKEGMCLVDTVVNRGRYIGAKGVHMNPLQYEKTGWAEIPAEGGDLEEFDEYSVEEFLKEYSICIGKKE